MRAVNSRLQEFERYISAKKVAIVGINQRTKQLIDYLTNIGAIVTIFDKKPIEQIDKDVLDKITSRCANFSFGEHCLVNLVGFNVILRTEEYRPDSPELSAEAIRGALVTSLIELALKLCPCKTIGITRNYRQNHHCRFNMQYS